MIVFANRRCPFASSRPTNVRSPEVTLDRSLTAAHARVQVPGRHEDGKASALASALWRRRYRALNLLRLAGRET